MVCQQVCPFLRAVRENSDQLLSSGVTSGQFLSSEGLAIALWSLVELSAQLVALLLFPGGCLPATELLVFSHSGPYHLEHPRVCWSFRTGHKPG